MRFAFDFFRGCKLGVNRINSLRVDFLISRAKRLVTVINTPVVVVPHQLGDKASAFRSLASKCGIVLVRINFVGKQVLLYLISDSVNLCVVSEVHGLGKADKMLEVRDHRLEQSGLFTRRNLA